MKKKGTRIYFASDIHGSQKCFNKFINAGKFYDADVLIMGGDITGKSVLFITAQVNGTYGCYFMGREYSFISKSELDDFTKLVKGSGYYPYTATQDEIDTCMQEPRKMDELFYRLMHASLGEWLDFAENRLKETGIRCYIIAGNDDPEFVAEFLRQSTCIINPEDTVVQIDDFLKMVSIGWSNPTPWNSPRECSEEELKTRIDKMMRDVLDPRHCILCAHVPPYNTGLDDAPVVTDGFKVKSSMGQVEFRPAGSSAVLDAIKQYGYILSLHGHIHEAHAVKRIGETVCINPGSDYGEGALHGALASFNKNKLESYQLVSG